MIQYSWCMIVSSGVLSRYRIYVRTVPVGAGAVFTFQLSRYFIMKDLKGFIIFFGKWDFGKGYCIIIFFLNQAFDTKITGSSLQIRYNIFLPGFLLNCSVSVILQGFSLWGLFLQCCQ